MWKKVLASVLAVALIGYAGFYFVTERELDRMWGGLTGIADPDLSPAGPANYAIIGADVLAPSGDRFLRGYRVMIEDGVIVSVEENAGPMPDVPVIDGEGLFLIPGLTDSHVHLWESENDLLLYLANGVTSVREMNGSAKMLRWRDEIAAGRPGPDLFITAPQLGTFGPIEGAFVGWTQRKTIVRSRKDIEKAVRRFERMGYDALKSSSFLSDAHYAAFGDVAGQSALALTGHIPVAADLEDFFSAGPSEVAHVEEIAKALDRAFGGYTPETAEAYLDFVRSRSGVVAQRLKAEGIAATSTLFLIDSIHRQRADVGAALADVELAYANPGITEGSFITDRGMGWLPDVNIYRADESWDEARRARSVAYWKVYAQAQHIVFEALLEEGVTILAGTDANVPPMVPGFSLHDELDTLEEAGMSPAEVLASATAAPAGWEGQQRGRIAEGYEADLVLLRENPLQNISATRSIEMVVKSGRVFGRSDLDAMLHAVKEENDVSRTASIPVSN
ncbi:MAG: amidohydrolase family protein [Parvularcula sp.]|jgi:hypothetical protein|nr:amidohydrolase family protein [Parvularcula sp.]